MATVTTQFIERPAYWERATQRIEQEWGRVKQEVRGSQDEIKHRLEERKEQAKPSPSSGIR